MIISIAGAEGSGKSTIGKMLAERLGWPRYYIGGIRRQKAAERGLTLAEYNKLGETDPSTDLEVDDYQKNLGQKEDDFVIEGRTSWYFIPHSFKVYLDVSLEEGARRIFGNLAGRNESNGLKTVEDVKKSLLERRASDKKRYGQYFNIDAFDPKNFDLMVDTTERTVEEVFSLVLAETEKRLKEAKKG